MARASKAPKKGSQSKAPQVIWRLHIGIGFGVVTFLALLATSSRFWPTVDRDGSLTPADVVSLPAKNEAEPPLVTPPSKVDTARSMTLPADEFAGPIGDEIRLADPANDNWPTESFNAAAGKQLKEIGSLLRGATDWGQVKLLTGEFRCSPLRPAKLVEVFRDASLIVRRAASSPAVDDISQLHEGPAAMEGAVSALVEPYEKDAEIHFKAKTVDVSLSESEATTEALIQISVHGNKSHLQQNMTWQCKWERSTASAPRLLEIVATDFEEVVYQSFGPTMFVDCTRSALGHNRSLEEQTMRGIDYWRARFEYALSPDMNGTHGLAVGDISGDGLEDVYICEPGGLPNRLFIRGADGRATDAASAAGVDWMEPSYAALIVDMDNDGDQDLIVASAGAMLLHENDGQGHLEDVSRIPIASGLGSLAAADFDSDGDLDIFACGYTAIGSARENGVLGLPVPYHDAENGGANLLLRNDGDWQLADVTNEVGLGENNRRFSWAAAWEDYDRDGDPDLYVANDFGRNNLYENEGGHFADVAARAGVEDISAGMSVSWGDYNNDGRMDIYVSNMFSAAGHRVTYQRQFRPAGSDKTRRHYQRHARGNTLFENAGNGTFRDVSLEAGVTMGRWAWGSRFADLNNDGREDLVVVNGFVTNQQTEDL